MKSVRSLAESILRRTASPFIPRKKMLPFKLLLLRIRDGSDPYLFGLSRFKGSSKTAIDIGANVGFFTYQLSRIFERVYSFEINDSITGMIKAYNPGNIELFDCGLSSTARTATFFLPTSGGEELTGWGTLHRDILPQANQVVEKDCRLATLDEFGITMIDFIKIDVEGHELEVLKGAAKTIEACRPIILIEVRTLNERDIELWFHSLHYRQCRYLESSRLVALTHFLPSTGDCVYVPDERLKLMGIQDQASA